MARHVLADRWSQQCRDQGLLVRYMTFKNGAGFVRMRPNLMINERPGRPGTPARKAYGCMTWMIRPAEDIRL